MKTSDKLEHLRLSISLGGLFRIDKWALGEHVPRVSEDQLLALIEIAASVCDADRHDYSAETLDAIKRPELLL